MNRKHLNRSTEKVLQQRSLNTKSHYERKCHTPSLTNHHPKKQKSKTKQKSIDRKNCYSSIKNVKYNQMAVPTIIHHKKQSPFKHKNRPISNIGNYRHAKNIEHQLSNLNQSVFNEVGLNDSIKKTKYDSVTIKSINDAKRHMKNNHFEKAYEIFSEQISKNDSEIQYLRGVCAFHLQMFDQVIKTFGGLVSKDSHFRKNVYLFLAISFKKRQLWEDALLILSKCIEKDPKYYDALILRAKILAKMKRYYDAIQDLNKCTKLQPKNIQAHISKGDCLRSLNQPKEAIKIYSEIMAKGWDFDVMLKRGIAYIQCEMIDEALKDFNRIIQKNSKNSQAYLFKGMAYSRIKNYNEAILSYEQAIKYNTSRKATTKAIYEVSKLKIQMGDYYGASYTLERANSFEVDTKIIEKMKMFVEGATFIMKKKYKKGIQNMNILAKKQHLNQQIKPLVYSFRSYAHFCQSKYSNALSDLSNMIKSNYQLDSSSTFNFELLEGIINCQHNDFNDAIDKFKTAIAMRKQFSDPYAYMCLTKVSQYNRNPKTKNKQHLEDSLQFIAQAIQKQDNFNYYYICSAILYTLGEYQESLENIEKAIQKSDDHVIKHFYLRGLIRGMLERNKQAYVDFNNVLSLVKDLKEKQSDEQTQKQIVQVYLQRAKCNLLFGEKKKAFQDLQTYISFKPLDSEIHTVAGKLLFSIGACQDAIKAYNYSPNIEKKRDQLLDRAKCYLVMKQLNLCLKDMEKIVELGDNQMRFDYCCLSSLKQASKGTQESFRQAIRKITVAESFTIQKGEIFSQPDFYFFRGVYNFFLSNYAQAQKFFQKSKNLKALNNQLETLPENFTSEDFQNRVYTNLEIQYNIALCDLLQGNIEASRKTLSKYESFNLIFQNSEQQLQQFVDLTPFPLSNRLCSIFDQIQYNQTLRFKLSFCLPAVNPPQIKFQIESKIIQELGMNSIESRPDAPWIKRNHYGVIFTDDMVGFDVDIKTEKSIKKADQIKIQAEQEEDMPSKSPQSGDKRSRLQEMFALDSDVEDRLTKLMGKKGR